MLDHSPSSPTPRTALHETARASRRRRRGLIRLSTLASVAALAWTIGGGSPAHSAPPGEHLRGPGRLLRLRSRSTALRR